MRRVSLIVALALLAGAPSCSADESEFDAALRAARENVKTSSSGAEYDQAFAGAFAEKHANTMSSCTAGLDAKAIHAFDVVARVSDAGKLETILVSPSSVVADCLRKAMTDDTYPPPPQPHHWVNLHMAFSQ